MNKVTSEDTSSMKIKWQCDSGGGEAVRDREVRGVDVNEENRQATSRYGGGVFLAERIVGTKVLRRKCGSIQGVEESLRCPQHSEFEIGI